MDQTNQHDEAVNEIKSSPNVTEVFEIVPKKQKNNFQATLHYCLILFALILAIVGIQASIASSYAEINSSIPPKTEAQKTPVVNSIKEKLKKVISKDESYSTMIFGGDIMMGRGVARRVVSSHKGDYTYLFDALKSTFQDADLVFANLEGALSDKGREVGNVFSFRFDPVSINALTSAGIDVVSQANNHMFDWGSKALCDSHQRLTAAGIGVVGSGCNLAEANTPYETTINGTSIGIIGFTQFAVKGYQATETTPGMTIYSLETIKNQIDALKAKGTQIIIVSLHWGVEYQNTSEAWQVQFAHELIDEGATLVIGHHPHVDQQLEQYKNGFIAYSLGNLVFDQKGPETKDGLLVFVKFKDGKIIDFHGQKILLGKDFQPRLTDTLVYTK